MNSIRQFHASLMGILGTCWFAYLAWKWRGEAFSDGRMNPEMGPVVIFLGTIVGFAVLGFVLRTVRGAAHRARVKAVQAADDQPLSNFDADAAFAHYMANRPADAPAPSPTATAAAEAEPPVPPRPSFGRRGQP